MTENTEVVQVGIITEEGLQTVALADLAGVDMTQVEEYRGGEAAPEGVAEWKLTEVEIGTREVNDKEQGQVDRAVVGFTCEAIAYRNCKDASTDPGTLIGTIHIEMFFIKDLVKDLGRVKAFLQDMGRVGNGPLQALCDAAIGHEFVGAIKHRKDKNDTSRIYANFDFKTIAPLGGATVTSGIIASPGQIKL